MADRYENVLEHIAEILGEDAAKYFESPSTTVYRLNVWTGAELNNVNGVTLSPYETEGPARLHSSPGPDAEMAAWYLVDSAPLGVFEKATALFAFKG